MSIRLDHIAYRTVDRKKTVDLLCKLYNYQVQDEFVLDFDDGTQAKCSALEPKDNYLKTIIHHQVTLNFYDQEINEYYKPPEFFVSEGKPGSIVYEWLKAKGIQSGIHHIALEVASVKDTMKWWLEKGFCGFSTEEPIYCPESGLMQIFTKEVPELGHVIEFISRTDKGFCSSSVKKLIEMSK